ncbi:MAG: hypothetical protein ACYTGP_08410 [Planctomycetota bacterium]|jgi:hypothetical protein
MKNTNLLLTAAAAVGLLAWGHPASADHIPGHSNEDPTFPVPIPGQSEFSGGAMWVTAIGPVGGSEMHSATFDITFVSDGQTPASDLLLNVSLFIDEGPAGVNQVETVVTGADLGFGSGPGTFHGTFETTDLNGIAVEHFLVAPYSLMDIIVDAVGGGGIQGTGYFVDSFIHFDLVGAPSECPWDLDGDGTVGFGDLLDIIAAWDSDPGGPPDFDGNHRVDFGDVLTLISHWGACP